MFSITFRRLYYISDKVVARNLRNRRVPQGPSNPGLQNRITAFRKEGLKIEDNDAEEFVEQADSDFYNVGEAYKEHIQESIAGKLDLRHMIVKDKYFKENLPNLLTWSEKEQIRHLATTDPSEWTPEKIAESFPVTVTVVKKLLKYPWRPATKERIARHDASAMRNWKELKEGTLDISEDLRNHFLKFSERTIPPLNEDSIKIDLTPEKDMGEFERIINRCASKDEESNKDYTKNTTETNSKHNETKQKRDFKRVTLDELADKIKTRLEKGKEINVNDSMMLNTVSSTTQKVPEATAADLSNEIEILSEEKKTDLTHFKENEIQADVHDYTQRIRIPKKAYKRGTTYKVNDCYYDDDGKFLYRVLGMKN
ncbi:uncharacterized protein LOC126370976 [Pectinophora gossypiella]|nr:uncharacterized protein LOC126370976 [Pectinophora gossypiella]